MMYIMYAAVCGLMRCGRTLLRKASRSAHGGLTYTYDLSEDDAALRCAVARNLADACHSLSQGQRCDAVIASSKLRLVNRFLKLQLVCRSPEVLLQNHVIAVQHCDDIIRMGRCYASEMTSKWH